MPDPRNGPGVYIEERDPNARPMAAADTSTTLLLAACMPGDGSVAMATSLAEFSDRHAEEDRRGRTAKAVSAFFGNGGNRLVVARLARLDAASVTALGAADLPDFSLVAAAAEPEGDAAAFHAAALDLASSRRAFYVAGAPAAWFGGGTFGRAAIEAGNGIFGDSADMAVYAPPLVAADGEDETFCPSAAVAGVIARTDAERGVWKAPAGAEAFLTGVAGVSCVVSDDQAQSLSDLHINAIRTFPGRGTLIWQARTRSPDTDYRYVPVRRMALFIQKSVVASCGWVVFEPNGELLCAKLTAAVSAFMDSLFKAGAFPARKPQEAWFVTCDRGTTSDLDIEAGRIRVVIGFAPIRPAEFVVFAVTLAAAPP